MIQQRPNETEEEYEKRKRRVMLTMMGVPAGSGSQAAGSPVLAAIQYNMDTFNVDVSNLRTIDNAGSEGATADGAMYGSNHIYLGATQSVTYTTVNTGDYAYFDVTTKAHVKGTATAATTTISTPTHHSNFFSLKAGKSISAGDITTLNANHEDIARMVKGVATVGTYSFILADIEAFYPGNEGEAGGANIYDVTDGTWATFSAIVNYTASCRTTYKNTNYGASNLLYTQDATGRLTGMADDNLTEFNLDGRYVSTGWTPSDASDFKIHVVANITSGTSSTPSTLIGGGRTRMYYRGDVNRVYAYFFNISVQDNSPITNALVMYSMEYIASSKTITLYKNGSSVSTLSGITPSPLPYSMFLGAKNLAGATEFFDGTIGKVIIDTNDTYTIAEAYALAKTMYPTLP